MVFYFSSTSSLVSHQTSIDIPGEPTDYNASRVLLPQVSTFSFKDVSVRVYHVFRWVTEHLGKFFRCTSISYENNPVIKLRKCLFVHSVCTNFNFWDPSIFFWDPGYPDNYFYIPVYFLRSGRWLLLCDIPKYFLRSWRSRLFFRSQCICWDPWDPGYLSCAPSCSIAQLAHHYEPIFGL